MPRTLRSVAPLLAALVLLGGCELIASVDRGDIPDDSAGAAGSAGTSTAGASSRSGGIHRERDPLGVTADHHGAVWITTRRAAASTADAGRVAHRIFRLLSVRDRPHHDFGVPFIRGKDVGEPLAVVG